MGYDKYCWEDTQEREEIRINKEINNTFVFPDTYRKLKDASSAKVQESNIPIDFKAFGYESDGRE
ncbi:hypothetical protein [Aliarcobacter butzleri]|uniref:Uncharacterized protein n=1 Tax=Aliarcobacter butzleri L348 TaxID=1447256 RepID=A0A0G9K619_9BACT|nr:hypothetical protein [Aliarcobacter butzleri]KLE01911.1 hypothetical protein AA20_02000 [Aliarcobacter butzleri L348]